MEAMKKPTFLHQKQPLLTVMLQAHDPHRTKELMRLSYPEGAEAFGIPFCMMKAEYRNKETYKELFEAAHSLPVYVTNYRKEENQGKSDEELAEELLELAECGATLCDVMGDYFDPCEGELTTSSEAIEKQMRLTDELHARGAEVIMSSHVLKFTPAERVLEIALEHQRRGADICKIVTGADSTEQEIENLRIIDMLKQKLTIPFLFLCGGECRIVRRLGGKLGCSMYLCVHEHDQLASKDQPVLREAKIIRDLI